MATCPKGHTSVATDYCDECGAPIDTPQLGSAQLGSAQSAAPAAAPVAAAGELATELPRRTGAVAGWRVVAAADRGYHDRMLAQAGPDAPEIPFPAFCPERRFALRAGQLLIGRRRPSRGIEPDIDLTGPPEDAAVSHAHALLVGGPDGAWAVVDLDSANGTYVNESTDAIEPHVPVPLK